MSKETTSTLPLDDTKKVYWVSNKGLVLEKHGEKIYAFLTLGRGNMIAPATEAELVDAGFNLGSFNGFDSDRVALSYAVDVLKGNI